MTIPVVSSITFDNCTIAGTAFGKVTYYVQGSNFAGITAATIGGNAVTIFSGDGSTWFRVITMPAHAAGVVDVTVTNASGTGTGVGIFTYIAGPAIGALSPPTGIAPGGGVVGIAGSGFTGATSVTFGGVAATIKAVPNDNSIIVIAPAHAAGAVDVTVTAPSGTSTLTGAFTYTVPVSPARNLYLFDDCCHNWFSSDTGGTFREGATPSAPGAPFDTGTDPHGVGTMLDTWSDASMAINDGDYLTVVGWDEGYNSIYGVNAVSMVGGQNFSWTLIDYESGSPAFSNLGFGSPAPGGAIGANGTIMLAASNSSFGVAPDRYARLTKDGGATWTDTVIEAGAGNTYQRACFGAGATTMYIKPLNDYLWKSVNTGVSWTQLVAGPSDDGGFGGEATLRVRCSADGLSIGYINPAGIFQISKDGGATWASTNLLATTGNAGGRYADFGITPDGKTIVVSFEQIIDSGYWPAVFISTNGGTTFTNISANLKYPALVGPPLGIAPGNVATGCTQCNVSPDGLGVVVTFIYNDFNHTDADGIANASYLMYANVSTDAGATFKLVAYDADPYQSGSFLGLFTGIYITPYTFIPPPGPIPPPFTVPKGGYIIERLDNRVWPTVENVWAVDCGFTLAQPTPDAELVIVPVPP